MSVTKSHEASVSNCGLKTAVDSSHSVNDTLEEFDFQSMGIF